MPRTYQIFSYSRMTPIAASPRVICSFGSNVPSALHMIRFAIVPSAHELKFIQSFFLTASLR